MAKVINCTTTHDCWLALKVLFSFSISTSGDSSFQSAKVIQVVLLLVVLNQPLPYQHQDHMLRPLQPLANGVAKNDTLPRNVINLANY